jgi:hypothetical protein
LIFKVNRKNSDHEIYQGYLEPLSINDLPGLIRDEWLFPWDKELYNTRHITYKLLVKGTEAIQGLISFEDDDGFVLIHYLETAPYNFNSKRGFKVAPALISFACINSFQKGYDGFVCIHIKIKEWLLIRLLPRNYLMYTCIKESDEMLNDKKQRISHDLDEMYEEAEQENNGIFAYPIK